MEKLDLTSDFERFHFQMERIWSRAVSGSGPQAPGYCTQVFAPPADVYQRNGEVFVVIEIAGIRGTEVHLQCDGQQLTVSGAREDPSSDDARSYSQIEVCRGEFQRALVLPSPVDVETMRISYDDGFLRLAFAKAPQPSRFRLRRTAP
jgi:HSP20 family protein